MAPVGAPPPDRMASSRAAGAFSTHHLVRQVVDAIDQGFALFDENDHLVFVNHVYKQIFAGIVDVIRVGAPFELLIRTAAARSQNIEAINDPEGWVQGRLERHRSASGVYVHKFADGRWIEVRERKSASGHTIGTYTDVTSLVQRTEEARAARDRLDVVSRRLKDVIEASSDWVWSSDGQGVVSCEPQTARLVSDFDPAPIIAQAVRAWVRAAASDLDSQGHARGLKTTTQAAKLPDGRTVFLKINAKPVTTEDGRHDGYVGTASDETPKIEMQAEAARHTALLESMLESMLIGVVVFSADRRVAMANQLSTEVLGQSVPHGSSLEQLRPCMGDEWMRTMLQWSADAKSRGVILPEVQLPSGAVLATRANFMRTGGFVVTLADVTEQRRVNAMAQQSQKLIALGQLTGGVAHEFNNLLTSIGGFTEMARAQAGQPEMVRECLSEVISGVNRAAKLTQQMLTFSRRGRCTTEVIAVADMLRGMQRLLEPLLPETVALELVIDDETLRVRAEETQLSQVVMNLVLNARDAMPRGGKVTVRLDQGAGPQGVEPGRWLLLSVADQGTGIDAATLPRIFDPFFTTKEQGKGTGLGLSVVHGVMKSSGGTIGVESTLGEGTTFLIHLPLVSEAIDKPETAPAQPAAQGQGQRIIVVEDEPGVRSLVEKTLRSQGYRVHAAQDHEELASLLPEAGEPALLLTDVVLPGKSGPEIAVDMQQRFPGLKVIFMSGYIAPGIEMQDLIDPQAKLLNKPFSPEALCKAIGEELAALSSPETPSSRCRLGAPPELATMLEPA